MGSGRALRIVGVAGAVLSILLFWFGTLLPWGVRADDLLNAFDFAGKMGAPRDLPDMVFGGFRYLSGFGILITVPATVIAVTAGVHRRTTRILAGLLVLLSTVAVTSVAVMTAVSAQSREARSAMVGWSGSIIAEMSLYVLTAAAGVALITGAWRFYGWYGAGLMITLALLHAGSLADYMAQSGHAVRPEPPAWLPIVWYLGAATGAALAMFGASARIEERRRLAARRMAEVLEGPTAEQPPVWAHSGAARHIA
jgi:hypothetical protein